MNCYYIMDFYKSGVNFLFIISVIVKILTNFKNSRLPGHRFWKKWSWKSHGILNGRRCTNPGLIHL
jgi:hypothetical protein